MNKIGAKGNNVWIWIVAIVVVLMLAGVINVSKIFSGKGTTEPAAGGGIYYAPEAAYSTVDHFGATAVGGTIYYADDGSILQTSAPKLTIGKEYTYWVLNGSNFYVAPKTFKSTGSDNVVNSEAYKNGSVTITGYDLVNSCNANTDVATNSCNVSTTANTQSRVEIKYLGGAKTAVLPFGGVMVIEYNSTIPTVGCSGDGVVGLNSKYQVTYTDTATSMTHKVYELADGFDIGTGAIGVTKKITCETVTGDTAAVGGNIKVSFIAANYYIGNDGKLHLDVEKAASGTTARTGIQTPTQTFYTK